MGDVIRLPKRPRVIEHHEWIKTYGEFNRMSLVLARSTVGYERSSSLTLLLDQIPGEMSFEVLASVDDTPEGAALADRMAHAVTKALTHFVSDE